MEEAPRKRRRTQATMEKYETINITTVIETKSAQHHSIVPSNDIMYDILLRLPVKTLRLFKCVCKSWNALISDPIFVKSHLNRTTFNTINYCNIINTDSPYAYLNILDRQASRVNLFCTDLVPSHVTDDDSFLFWPYQVLILGSCNGLILTTISSITQLWNPTTGESKALARCALSYEYMDQRYYISGLGYDSNLNKYKAVIFTTSAYFYGKSTSCMFLCTSSKSRGKWKSVNVGVNDFPYDITTVPSRLGITVNGSPHWIVTKSKEEYNFPATIIYFDMAGEKFKMLPTLPPVPPLSTLATNIALLEGCLCVIYADRGTKSFDVWSMTEYGVTWTKIFVFQHPCDSFRPLGYISNGDEVVMEINRRYIMSHNLSTSVNNYIDAIDFESGDYVAYSEHLFIPGSPFVESARKTKKKYK